MARTIGYEDLLAGCADDSLDNGIVYNARLEPLAGHGTPVKPARYEKGVYLWDKRWRSYDDDYPTEVIVLDNTPSQANRLEQAIWVHRSKIGVPEFVLDLSDLTHLPAHLPRKVSSWHFPLRNADSYLRDSLIDGNDFQKTEIGSRILSAAPWSAGPLLAWFPHGLLFGFWQSYLGKKRANTKHARAWVSEIIGWSPAAKNVKAKGMKGDPLNLSVEQAVTFNPEDRQQWELGKKKTKGTKTDKLSEIGHGKIPFLAEAGSAYAGVSFADISQRSSISFAQLRKVSLGEGFSPDDDAAARAILVALGLHAHVLAFGQGFVLRSGAELVVRSASSLWLGYDADEAISLGGKQVTERLLREAVNVGRSRGLPLDGWGAAPVTLEPKPNLRKTITATWPDLDS